MDPVSRGVLQIFCLATAWLLASGVELHASEVEFRIIEIDPLICPHMIIKRTDVNEGRFFYIPRVTLALDRFNRTYLFDVWNLTNGDRIYSFRFSFLSLDDIDYAAEVFAKQCDKDKLMLTLQARGEVPAGLSPEALKNFYPGPIIPSAVQMRLPLEYQQHVLETPNAVLENDLIAFAGSSPITLLIKLPPEKQTDFDLALTSDGGIPIGIRLQFATRMLLGFLKVSLNIKDVYTWIDANIAPGQAIPWGDIGLVLGTAFQNQAIDYQVTRLGDLPDDTLGTGQIEELVQKLLEKHLAKEFGANDAGATQPGGVPAGELPKYFVFNLTAEHRNISRTLSLQLTNLSSDQTQQWALIPYDLSIQSSVLDGIRQIMVEHKNFGDNATYSHIKVNEGDLIKINLFGAWEKAPKRTVTETWLKRADFEGPALDSNDFLTAEAEVTESRYIGQTPKIWAALQEDSREDDQGELFTYFNASRWFFWLGVNHYKKYKIRKYEYATPEDPDHAFVFNKIDIRERYREPWLVPLGLRIGNMQLIPIRDYVRGREDTLEYHYDATTNVMSFRADRAGQLYFGNLEPPEKKLQTAAEFFTVTFENAWKKLFGRSTIKREVLHDAYTYQQPIEHRTIFAFHVQALPKGMEHLSEIEQNLQKRKNIQPTSSPNSEE